MSSGLFLSLEGIDFTWKTPFVQWLSEDLSNNWQMFVTRDPPYFLSPWDSFNEFFELGENISHVSEAMLLLTARIDNFHRVISPALKQGALVIADRYVDSWFAYQAVRLAPHFDDRTDTARSFLRKLNSIMVEDGLLQMPNLTLLISDDPERTIQRASETTSKYERLDFQIRVHEEYKLIAREYPERIITIDVREKDIYQAYAIVRTVVKTWLTRYINREQIFPNISMLNKGDRILSLCTNSWTVDEFEDYPLIIESGDHGIVIEADTKSHRVTIEWDKDEFKRLKKSLMVSPRLSSQFIVLGDT